MGFKNNDINYGGFSIFSSYCQYSAYGAMTYHGTGWFVNNVKDKSIKAAIINGKDGKDNYGQEEAKEVEWIAKALERFEVLSPSDEGLDISDIEKLAVDGYKVILICNLDAINGNGFVVLKKLAALSVLYDVDIRVAIENKAMPITKLSLTEYNWGFADEVVFRFEDPKDSKKCIDIRCIPAGIKELPKEKKR